MNNLNISDRLKYTKSQFIIICACCGFS